MKKIVTLVFFMLVVSPASSAQDGLKGLKDYLKSVKYTVFVPPRENVTLNTVVNYERGYESVVTSRCIPIDRVPPSSLAPVALTSLKGNMGRTLGIEGSFARTLDPAIDISGAFSDARVGRVEVEISNPQETHIESNDLKEYIKTLSANSSCLRSLTNKKNRVFNSLLQVDGIKYTFYDKNDRSLGLDLKLLQAIKLAPKYQRQYENTNALEIKTPIFVGYRAWEVSKIPGAAVDRVELRESEPDEIAALKRSRGSRRRPNR